MKSKILSLIIVIALIFTGTMKIERVSAAGSETIKFSVRYGQTDARKMADKLNAFRAENGKSALTYDYNLEKVAMQRAAEIAVRFKTDDKDTNIRPDGQTYKQTLADFGFDISPRGILYGENILFGTKDSMELDSAFTMLCSTEENRVEMLGYYQLVGIGHIKIEDKTDFWVQVFANRGTAGDYTSPVDGEMEVSVKVDPSIVTDVNVEYTSGDHSVAAGSTVQVPSYIPKIKVAGSEMEEPLVLSPLSFESNDGVVMATNGTMTGLKEGTGNISASLCGRTFSYSVTVTAGSGYIVPSPTQTVTTAPTPTQNVVTSAPTPTQTVVTSTPSPTQAIVTTAPTPTQAIVTSVPSPTQTIITSSPTQTATPTPTSTNGGGTKLKKGEVFAKDGLKYKVTGANTVEVIGLSSNSAKSISIPATVELGGVKYKVTKIAANAFKGEKKIKTVTIGKNVKTIGKSAFYGCSKLKTISFSGGAVKSIGKKAFTKINSKAVITVSSSSYTSYKKLLVNSGYSSKITKS